MKSSTFLLFVFLSLLGTAYAQDAQAPPVQPEPDAQAEMAQPEEPVEPVEAPAEDAEEIAQEKQEKIEHFDIIFAIDASGSVGWTDPTRFRTALVNSLIDITQNGGGDRISVIQFAGWNETAKAGSVIFNLTPIPEMPKLREFLLLEIKNAVETRLANLGVATDFNYLFEKAVKEILGQRGETGNKNKIWLIIVSDGSMEVVEGEDVREAYRAKLVGESKIINRPNLNQAAMEIFQQEVLPGIAANKDLYITCINLGKGEPGEALAKIAELPNTRILNTSDGNLKSVLVEMFAAAPEEFPDYGLPRGFGYFKSDIVSSSEITASFKIYQGATSSKILLLGTTDKFSLDIKNKDGISIAGKPNITMLGKGACYRLIDIANEKFGEYDIVVSNTSGSTEIFELLEYSTFDYTPFIGAASLGAEFYPGESLLFEVGLRDTRTGMFITDSSLIPQIEAVLSITDVDGNVDEQVVKFLDTGTAETTVRYTLPEDAPGGEYLMEVKIAAIKDTVSGKYAYVSEPVEVVFSVLSPVVELNFSLEEALLGQEVDVVGKVTMGALAETQKQEGILTKVIHAVSHAQKDVQLAWDEESGSLRGKVVLDKVDEWRLQKSALGTGQIKPSVPGKISIKQRELRILQLDASGKKIPVDMLTMKGSLEETSSANLLIEMDLMPGEDAIISHKFIKKMDMATISTTLSGKANAATELILSDNPCTVITLTLKLKDVPDKQDVGELAVAAEISGVSIEKSVRINTEVAAKPFPWLYVVLGGAGALLLLILLLILLLGGPTFEEQQLYLVGGSGHHLSEWKTGKKTATGTSEVAETLQFRLKGGKKQPVCMVMPGKNTRVFVNNIESTYWTEVHHGDYVEVYPVADEYSYRYRYFDRTPTSGELQVSEDVTQELGAGVFLGEDEFILADDDDDLAAATGDATQALLEQARRMKEGVESEGTQIIVESSGGETAEPPATEAFGAQQSYEETQILREAAQTPFESDFTEAVPQMPGEATEAISSEYFQEESEEVEVTQVIGADEEPVFEEIIEEGPLEEGFSLPLSEDVVDSEATQAIGGDEIEFEEMESEPTQAIMSDEMFGEAMTEPTEEIADEPVEEMTGLIEERLEMSEFIDEEEQGAESEGGDNLADELDRTFDQILGDEEKEGDL